MDRRNISGVRRLYGEDLSYGDRVYKQRVQQRMWLEEQMREKASLKQKEREESQKWQNFFKDSNTYVKAAEEVINSKFARMQQEIKEANLQLMREKQEQQNMNHQHEVMAGEMDKHYNLTNAFMTENTMSTQSALAPHRVLPYHFKGLSDTQKQDILNERARQIQEKKLKFEQEKAKEAEEAKLLKLHLDVLTNCENQIKHKERMMNREHREYLKTQMLEDKLRNADPFNLNGTDFLIPYK